MPLRDKMFLTIAFAALGLSHGYKSRGHLQSSRVEGGICDPTVAQESGYFKLTTGIYYYALNL